MRISGILIENINEIVFSLKIYIYIFFVLQENVIFIFLNNTINISFYAIGKIS